MDPSGCEMARLVIIVWWVERPTTGHYFLVVIDDSQLDRDALAVIHKLNLGFVFQGSTLLSLTSALASAVQLGRTAYRLPETPPSLFSRVRQADAEEHARFVSQAAFLDPLLRADDDCVAAFLRRSSQFAPDGAGFSLDMGRRLVPLLSPEP